MPTKFFGTLTPKTYFWQKSIKFFDTPIFLKQWRDAHEILRQCETKNFRRKNVIPLLCMNFFVTTIFLENRRGPLQNFSFRSCETKNFDRTVMPPPAHMHEKFWNKKFFETQICSAMRILAMWDKNFSKENRDNSPLSSIKCFPLPKNIETQNGLLAKFFRSCEIKETFDKTLKLPPLLLEKFRFQNSFETQKCSPRKFINLSALWDKNFSKYLVISPCYA